MCDSYRGLIRRVGFRTLKRFPQMHFLRGTTESRGSGVGVLAFMGGAVCAVLLVLSLSGCFSGKASSGGTSLNDFIAEAMPLPPGAADASVGPAARPDPDNPDDNAPDIRTSRDESALAYRTTLKEQNGYKAQAAALTKTVKGFYDAFRAKFGHRATRHTYTLKCLGLD